jgi:hypothetical protein
LGFFTATRVLRSFSYYRINPVGVRLMKWQAISIA